VKWRCYIWNFGIWRTEMGRRKAKVPNI